MKTLNSNISEIIKNHKRIAVIGLSPNPMRPSHGVAKMMIREGYEVVPVNPGHDEILGKKCYPSLSAVPGEIDLVDVFRQSKYVAGIVDEAIEKGVKAVWLQLGVIDEAAAQKALENDVDVVMDRCWAIEYH
ncbi:MAG: CoA-binding protein [Calditrichia bacterium]